jgi:hypothetical protein
METGTMILVLGAVMIGTPLLGATAAGAATVHTWFVSGGGNNALDCSSPANACATISHALTLVSPGDTIEVSGTIHDNVVISSAEGTPTAPITISGAEASPDSPAVVNGSSDGQQVFIIGDANPTGVVLDNLSIVNGTTTSYSGGVFISNTGTVTISDSTISGNIGKYGGGVFNSNLGTLTIDNSTISGNTAAASGTGYGGGINDGGTLTLFNSTVSGNTAASGGGGLVSSYASVSVVSSTITGNTTSGGGGGIDDGGNSVYVGASIVAGNIAGSGNNCYGSTNQIFSLDYNVSNDTACGFTATHDHQSVSNVDLGSLAGNGGPTATMLPTQSSAAFGQIPTGTTLGSLAICPGTDQRGVTRPNIAGGESRCTVGATEAVAGVAPGVISSANSVGFTVGVTGTFPVADTGSPSPTFSETGTLPHGLSLSPTGVLSGTPSTSTVGSFPITITASNNLAPVRTQSFTVVVSPAVVPSAPRNVQASVPTGGGPTDAAVVVWSAPASAGTSDITSYAVTPFDQTTGNTLGFTTAPDTQTTTTVSGLTAGDSYVFTVTATSAAGTSGPSGASNAVVPVAVAPDQSDSGSSSSPNGSTTASLGPPGSRSSITAIGSGGEGTLTVATYPSEPTGTPSVEGRFYDVSLVTGGPAFTQISVVFCGVPAGATLRFWDTATRSYVVVSNQSAPTGSGHCVTVTMNGSTIPDIADLTGTVFVVPPAPAAGYTLAGADGGVFGFGHAGFFGSLPGSAVHVDDVVGMANTAADDGYWLVAADGGVFSFGDARFHGSFAGVHLHAPIVGMAATADGGGYWLVAADGGVFAFGDARFSGSLPGSGIRADDVTGIAATADGGGYWLVGADGGVFSFGDAVFAGSMSAVHLVGAMVGIVPTTDGGGYWLVGTDGGVFALGDAGFFGSLPGLPVGVRNVVGLIAAPDGGGYQLVGADGGVYAFGDGNFLGSMSGRLARPAVGGTAA